MIETGRNRALPALVTADGAGRELIEHVTARREWIRTELLSAGALLFRGFHVGGVEAFDRVVAAISGAPLEYRERSSPRSRVDGNVYTSTDYPARYAIFQHNESSYASTWPLRLFFHCVVPAAEGGETPLADGRRVLGRIDPDVRRKFTRLGVLYVRNFGEGLGLSWSTVFQTGDRSEVERRCAASGTSVEWLPDGDLRTRHVGPATVRHPLTEEELWFNHATFFHVTTLAPVIRDHLLATCAADRLPSNTFYGDGSPIEDEVLDHLRDCYREETVTFAWRRDDVLLVDNMLTTHGRSPYRGQRRVLVAMAEAVAADRGLGVAGRSTSM